MGRIGLTRIKKRRRDIPTTVRNGSFRYTHPVGGFTPIPLHFRCRRYDVIRTGKIMIILCIDRSTASEEY
jgi:hypothetical protein